MPFKCATGVRIEPAAMPAATWAAAAVAVRRYPFLRQRTDNWCWVACVAMVEAAWNVAARSQCEIARDELGAADCCSSPGFEACDEPANLAGMTIALRNVRPQAISTLPVGEPWLQGQLAHGAIAALWEWDDHSGGPACHVVLIVGSRALSAGRIAYAVNDPWLTAPDELTYDELMSARGAGRWTYAWTHV